LEAGRRLDPVGADRAGMSVPVSLAVALTQEEQMRKGQKVETLTKTVGQTPRTGVVIDLREEDLVEVEWDDGHISIVTRSALIPTTGSRRSEDHTG
jgi:hypothetical protein